MTRRSFIGSAACLMAFNARAEKRLPICFSTLGCPKWELGRIIEVANANGYPAIELRGLMGEMDLTRRPEFSPSRIEQTRKELQAHGIRIASVDSSASMLVYDPAARERQMDEARRFIDLARSLDAPYVRVFPDRMMSGITRQQAIERIAGQLRELGSFAAGRGVTVLLESHGDFTDTPSLQSILELTGSKSVGLLWDAHHTFAFSNEDPAFTWSRLHGYIRHTHLKDSKPAGRERKLVLVGEGDVPVRKQVELLARGGYRGYYSLEWEKAWHPEMEDPEIAIPGFAKVMKEYLAAAGRSGA